MAMCKPHYDRRQSIHFASYSEYCKSYDVVFARNTYFQDEIVHAKQLHLLRTYTYFRIGYGCPMRAACPICQAAAVYCIFPQQRQWKTKARRKHQQNDRGIKRMQASNSKKADLVEYHTAFVLHSIGPLSASPLLFPSLSLPGLFVPSSFFAMLLAVSSIN